MALLSDDSRAAVLSEWMQQVSADHEVVAANKPVIVETIAALDEWEEQLAAELAARVPSEAAASLTYGQLVDLAGLTLRRRREDGL